MTYEGNEFRATLTAKAGIVNKEEEAKKEWDKYCTEKFLSEWIAPTNQTVPKDIVDAIDAIKAIKAELGDRSVIWPIDQRIMKHCDTAIAALSASTATSQEFLTQTDKFEVK